MRRLLTSMVLVAATALTTAAPAQATTTDPDPIGVCVTRTDTGEVICVIVWP